MCGVWQGYFRMASAYFDYSEATIGCSGPSGGHSRPTVQSAATQTDPEPITARPALWRTSNPSSACASPSPFGGASPERSSSMSGGGVHEWGVELIVKSVSNQSSFESPIKIVRPVAVHARRADMTFPETADEAVCVAFLACPHPLLSSFLRSRK